MLLIGSISKFRAIGLMLMAACLLSLCFTGLACKRAKQLPNEPQDVYKKRLTAIYVAQTATALDGTSDAINALVINEALSKDTGAGLLEVVSKAGNSWTAAKDRLMQGFFDKSATDKIDEAIKFVEELQASGVVGLKNPKSIEQFRTIISGARLALTSAKNLILALNGPSFDTQLKQVEDSQKAAVRGVKISVGLDLTTIVLNTLGRAAQQSWLPTAEAAYSDGAEIIKALLLKNAERIQSYKSA